MHTTTKPRQRTRKHSTCAWCHQSFGTIIELLDHVDNDHLEFHPSRPNGIHARGAAPSRLSERSGHSLHDRPRRAVRDDHKQ
jgi:hypothetical protein